MRDLEIMLVVAQDQHLEGGAKSFRKKSRTEIELATERIHDDLYGSLPNDSFDLRFEARKPALAVHRLGIESSKAAAAVLVAAAEIHVDQLGFGTVAGED